MGAKGDVMVPPYALEGWRQHSSGITGSFALRWFPGSHSFFLEAGEGQAQWVHCLATTIAEVHDPLSIDTDRS
jgi:surfactin synthase thioesterase subunit